MLTEIYIQALLVDEDLADQVWEAWDAGEIDDLPAWLAWWIIFQRPLYPRKRTSQSCTDFVRYSTSNFDILVMSL